MRTSRPILLVEDDRVDAMTVLRALKEIRVKNPIETAIDGERAIEILSRSKEGLPCLILLDLKMPRMGGLEFLSVVKQNPLWRRIPVVVLTSSREEQDKIASYDLGVAGYIVKPVDYEQFVKVVRTIDLYWTLSEIPNEVE